MKGGAPLERRVQKIQYYFQEECLRVDYVRVLHNKYIRRPDIEIPKVRAALAEAVRLGKQMSDLIDKLDECVKPPIWNSCHFYTCYHSLTKKLADLDSFVSEHQKYNFDNVWKSIKKLKCHVNALQRDHIDCLHDFIVKDPSYIRYDASITYNTYLANYSNISSDFDNLL